MQEIAISQRKRWPLVVAGLVVLIAILWIVGWYLAASMTARTVAAWKEREARSGRVHICGTETIGGFPFRIEVLCTDARTDLRSNQPPLMMKAKAVQVLAQVWQPTVLSSEWTGPLAITEPGQLGSIVVNWRSANAKTRGHPSSPERVTISLDSPMADQTANANASPVRVFSASQLVIDGRMISGTVSSNPVIEVTMKLIEAAAPTLHPATVKPLDADVTAVLSGLKNFAPKPWPARFRELQEAGGRIEISNARFRQGDTIATASGSLGLTPRGRLDGQLRVTVANLDKFIPSLGLDRMLSQQAPPNQINSALGALDRLAPGLGNVARQQAGPAIVAGINMMGQRTELEGQRAVTLPLRFSDGVVSLGPIPLGQTPPLF